MYSDEAGRLILQLYDLMDAEAQDRLNKIWKKGEFPLCDKNGKVKRKEGQVVTSVVNTIVGSVQREVKTLP